MARLNRTAKQIGKGFITWTRFHLPKVQEWPTWPVTHEDVHVGPLAGVKGIRKVSVGRIVENPEQAAYVIVWRTLEDLKNFQNSPACEEFLRNLQQSDQSQDSYVLGSALDNTSSSSSSSQAASRFLTFEHVNAYPTADLEGRVTFTAYMVPQKDDSMKEKWYHDLYDALGTFYPPGSEYLELHRQFNWRSLIVYFWLLNEDSWVEEKFGTLEQDRQHGEGRTIICEFRLWPSVGHSGDPAPEQEGSAANPEARDAWKQAVSKASPPVTAWEQERWDIRKVPRFPSEEE